MGGILLVSFLSGGLPAGFDVEGAARRVAEEPDDKMSGVSSAGAGCFLLLGLVGFGLAGSGVIGMMVLVMVLWFPPVVTAQFLGLCRLLKGLSFGGVILALQASDGVHLGGDNLGVVRHVGWILDGRVSSLPCELLPDGDHLLPIERMLHVRGLNTVRISKVKGHADEALVSCWYCSWFR